MLNENRFLGTFRGHNTRTNKCLLYIKKFINNSRGKYKRNAECLINVCKSDKDLS